MPLPKNPKAETAAPPFVFIYCPPGKTVDILSPARINSLVEEWRAGDERSPGAIFKSFLPRVCRELVARRGGDKNLLPLIARVESHFRRALFREFILSENAPADLSSTVEKWLARSLSAVLGSR